MNLAQRIGQEFKTLRDNELTLKFDKANIENILTSVSTTNALSAAQGKVLKDSIDSISTLLSSNDVDLDTLQEIVTFIKANKGPLDSLGIDSIIGLQTALNSKVDDSRVLTDVPTGAVFTDTVYDDTDVVKAPLGVLPALDGSQLTNMPVALPDQAGFAGKYLKTDGTIATWETAQEALVSGTSIKTINGTSVLGGGDIITPDTITAVNDTLTSISTTEALTANQGKVLKDLVDTKQDTLVSGTSIKTINGTSVLGSGDLDTTQTDVTGNAATATKLETTRTINGVSFDGTANITVSDNTKLTATNPAITGSITEQVYNLTGTSINPANGTIQYKTVSSNTTFTETLSSGQSVLLRLIEASNYTITFPTITWVGAAAPTLTANCALVIWKEQSTLYGAFVGTLV